MFGVEYCPPDKGVALFGRRLRGAVRDLAAGRELA